MARSATLAINIISDASGATRGLDEATSKVDKFKSGLDRASLAAGAAIGGIALIGKQAFDAASELQQTSGSIEAVFGKYSEGVSNMADDAARMVGLSKSKYQEMAAVIGAQLKNAGMSADTAATHTEDLIKTGADMAAVFGGTAADAVEALSSALKGEMDPIEKYGVSLNQTAIDTQLAADGHDKLTGAAQKAAQTQAILELITKQTADTQGQWNAQIGTAGESTQVASAAFDNAAATLGTALLPVITDLAGKLESVANWAQANQGIVQALIGTIGGLSAVVMIVNAAVKTWEAMTKIVTAAQWLWNAAMSANPLMLIVLAIAAVVAIVIVMYNKFSWFRDFVGAIAGWFVDQWHLIVNVIGFVADKVRPLGDIFGAVFAWIGKVMSPVVDVIKWIADKIQWVINKAKAVGDFFGGLFSAPAAPAPAGAGGGTRGLFGAPGGLRTAGLLTAGGGIGSSPSGAAPGLGETTVNITVNGALDPVAVGRQIQTVLRDYSRRTGQSVAVAR